MINIDITDRLFAAFGYAPSGKPKREVIQQGIAAAYASDAAISVGTGRANIAVIKSRIGANMYVDECSYADLTLRNPKDGTVYEFRNGILSDAISGVLAPPPMMKFERDKNIVTTHVDGSDSVVIESFGLDAWKITLDGILVDMENHLYPREKMQKLRELFETNTSFEVYDCDILADLNIENIYFEKLTSLELLKDYQDTIKYSLVARSIKPVEFFI
ncbi:MAG: DUF6046 domain-containing protein [Paludibacter sp.]|nr:DUF6046 domain-containing protein [Bacteroidales bacterium]MCM1068816.1 DUF6046 domain-containing protein [Prevotella sp.]MCM1353077.1 DUF6046 domain-containing protein [Bacteroides sp.]MCM1442399.1 DUF6046 domain-containing protein [Muribaculum sp.]MCM1481242.1 DUF6046 domain-containing protein [Paludibacter sp.]